MRCRGYTYSIGHFIQQSDYRVAGYVFTRHTRDTEQWSFSTPSTPYIDETCFEGSQGGDICEGLAAFVGELGLCVGGGDNGYVSAEGGFDFLVEVVTK